jgi:radical SAM protein with 4Fe4S-binding SPASM domain
MLVTVFTNGTLLTPRIADVLAERPPRFVEISLYGHSAETYERVTQVPGSYARCRQGIELLLDRGVRTRLKSVVLTVNRHELPQLMAFADQLGAEFRYDAMLWPRCDGGRQPWTYRLSPEGVVALDQDDPARLQKWQELHDGLSEGLSRGRAVFHCGAGYHGFHVDAAGRMSVCMMARCPAYDLSRGSFREGWEFLGDLRQKERQLDTACRTCSAGIVCIQCPGWSQMVHGDDETPVEFICEVGRLRASRLVPATH